MLPSGRRDQHAAPGAREHEGGRVRPHAEHSHARWRDAAVLAHLPAVMPAASVRHQGRREEGMTGSKTSPALETRRGPGRGWGARRARGRWRGASHTASSSRAPCACSAPPRRHPPTGRPWSEAALEAMGCSRAVDSVRSSLGLNSPPSTSNVKFCLHTESLAAGSCGGVCRQA